MDLQEKQLTHAKNADLKLGIYCHVPFCASTCDFCAFYQEKPRRGDLDLYLQAMEQEFALLPQDRVVDTVFWGGGTPGLLAAKDLERLGRSLLERMVEPPQEWTVEMAPSTVKADKLAVLRDLGVTRISMGVQSFDADLLESLGRLHRPNQIYTAWERIEAAGFPQTNLDLMFALPNQTIDQWEADIREAARLGPQHISTYCLTFEEDTALYVKLSKGELKIDEAKELRFYEHGWDTLAELGYAQYEISNFSKSGGECIHNLNTWRMQEWIGCGPSAASQYAGERYQRSANLHEWATAMEAHESPEPRESDSLSGAGDLKTEYVELDASTLYTDAIVFGLRMNTGVDLEELSNRYPNVSEAAEIEALIARFEEEKLVKRSGSVIQLSRKGQLICDGIGSEILAASLG